MLLVIAYVHCTDHAICSVHKLEKSPQTNPIIGRIECKAGHGAGRPTQKLIDGSVTIGFMAKMLDASWMTKY
ncbi:prolyl endopeptidase [Quercus suber]|uniref:Prolyl endopeptidase n=1 Tax=Quercus suber TaxID=58331 RepID=A0AAW0LSP1_QUESU